MSDTPDLSQYKDLRIYDRDAESIYELAEQDLMMKLPEWAPREDSTEVMLMQALSMQVSEAVFAINRLPGAVMTILMQLYGIKRDEGDYPIAEINVRVVDTLGHTIPAGTRFMLEMPSGLDPIIFSAIEATVIPAGNISGVIKTQGLEFTSEANGIPVGTNVEILEALTFVERCTIAVPVYGGRDAETDTEWANRGSARLRRLSDALVVPEHFTVAALEHPEVNRAVSLDLYNPESPTPAVSPGHVTVAVYGKSGTVSPEVKDRIREEFMASAMASLTVHIVDPTVTTVTINATVKSLPGYTDDVVRANIRNELRSYIDPDNWPWSDVVRYNELISLIDRAPGVDYVVSIQNPAADLKLDGIAPLAILGEVTVNFL